MNCPQCSQADVIQIEHVLPDGSEVLFFSCHNCEERWWNREGIDINIAEVLEIVRQNRS